MHQPFYKDGQSGAYHMPWVFLHAVKDYYEIPRYLKDYKGIRQTFNLVPSLLVQLKDYESTDVKDIFFQTMLKYPADLTLSERGSLVTQLFMANYVNMIAPFARYAELYSKNSRVGISEHAYKLFSDQEILDLEVLYLLSWIGEFFRKEYEIVKQLINKGAEYSQEDKLNLMEAMCGMVRRIIPLYKELMDEGLAEVSATPFYHPILPLLIDLESAKEARPEISMPAAFGDFKDDPAWHVSEAVSYYKSVFGRAPSGMWPAEGSISNKAAELFAQNGIRWIASDEDVLAGSKGISLSVPLSRNRLYRRHFYETKSGRINIFFRDKVLSDLIGFTYSSQDAEKSADDFVNRLRSIYDSSETSVIVPVILDGENAWEYYPKNAELFFRALYERILKESWITTVTMSEAMDISDVPEERLDNIRAGSWIYGDFTTWLGHREKNDAWRLLTAARQAVEAASDKDIKRKAMNEIYIAEGSDWFWWFGDDHFSLQADIFDKLFRGYLINAYTILELDVPQELYSPVKRTDNTGVTRKPSSYLSPRADGEITSFFEWLGAGEFDLRFDAGAMHSASNVLRKLFYAYDEKKLYIRIDGDFSEVLDNGCELEVEVTGSKAVKFHIPLVKGEGRKDGISWGINRIIELAGSYRNMPDNTGRIYLVFRIYRDGNALERAPRYNMVEIDLSDNFNNDWIV